MSILSPLFVHILSIGVIVVELIDMIILRVVYPPGGYCPPLFGDDGETTGVGSGVVSVAGLSIRCPVAGGSPAGSPPALLVVLDDVGRGCCSYCSPIVTMSCARRVMFSCAVGCPVSCSLFALLSNAFLAGGAGSPKLSTKSSVGCLPTPLVAHGVERTLLRSSLLYLSILGSPLIDLVL